MLTFKERDLPGGPVAAASVLPLQGVWVQSLVEKLESCMLSGTAKTKI